MQINVLDMLPDALNTVRITDLKHGHLGIWGKLHSICIFALLFPHCKPMNFPGFHEFDDP